MRGEDVGEKRSEGSRSEGLQSDPLFIGVGGQGTLNTECRQGRRSAGLGNCSTIAFEETHQFDGMNSKRRIRLMAATFLNSRYNARVGQR